jgi:hypothetical protein
MDFESIASANSAKRPGSLILSGNQRFPASYFTGSFTLRNLTLASASPRAITREKRGELRSGGSTRVRRVELIPHHECSLRESPANAGSTDLDGVAGRTEM